MKSSRKTGQKGEETDFAKDRFFEEDSQIGDPFGCHLPALVLEMRREHEEVVDSRNWIPFVLLPFIPAAGSIVLFTAALRPDRAFSKNIRNYALPAAVVSGIYTAALVIAFAAAMKYGHEIRLFVEGLKGG